MVNARQSYGSTRGKILPPLASPTGWWTLAGGNTPGYRPLALRPERSPERTAGHPIRPICPIRPIPLHHPQTNPHPKSTVDLGCEGSIKVENGLRSPLLPTGYRPISGPKIRGSNRLQTVTNQKIYSASPLIPASRSKCFPLFLSTTNEVFQVKTRPLFRHPILTYSTLCQPILPILTPLVFYRTKSKILIHRNFPRQTWSRLVQSSPAWSNTSEKKFMSHLEIQSEPSSHLSIHPRMLDATRNTHHVSPSLHINPLPQILFPRLMRLIRQHTIPGPTRTLPFLASDAFNLRSLRSHKSLLPFLNLVEQQSSSNITIQPLLPRLLTFHLNPRRAMNQHHASGRLVDVLPAMSARTHKRFVNVRFTHAQRRHALRKLIFFFQADRKCTHALIVAVAITVSGKLKMACTKPFNAPFSFLIMNFSFLIHP
jgi:hypothetical protein